MITVSRLTLSVGLACIAVGTSLALVPPASCASEIVGRVVQMGGAPVAGEPILLREMAKPTMERFVTDAHGRYVIENLKPGPYVLYVRTQSAVAYVDGAGLTVDWGLSPGAPPVAVATRGITEVQPTDPAATDKAPQPSASPAAAPEN